MAQARQEGNIATHLYFRIKKIESRLENALEHAKTHDLLHGKPHLQSHYAAKLNASLQGLRGLQREAQDLAETLHSIKRKSLSNVKSLRKDLRQICKC